MMTKEEAHGGREGIKGRTKCQSYQVGRFYFCVALLLYTQIYIDVCLVFTFHIKWNSIRFYWMQTTGLKQTKKNEVERERARPDCSHSVSILIYWGFDAKRASPFNLRLFISRKCVNCLNEGRTKVIDFDNRDMPISVFVDPFVRLDVLHILAWSSNTHPIRWWQPFGLLSSNIERR